MIATQINKGIAGNEILRIMATPPSIPPTCKILMTINKKNNQTIHFAFPIFGPGSLLKDCIAVSPVIIVCRPNSNCTATLTRQLTSITQKVINPACAPRVVVAMSSPDPTMEADRTNPGPRNFNFSRNLVGGAAIRLADSRYGSCNIKLA